MGQCLFCDPAIVTSGSNLSGFLRDAFPVTPLHTLVIPKRHVAAIDELSTAEVSDLFQLAINVKVDIVAADPSVVGFNLGINEGPAGGQTVMHLHVHIIPRRSGDTPDPRGGIRGVIPGKQQYP